MTQLYLMLEYMSTKAKALVIAYDIRIPLFTCLHLHTTAYCAIPINVWYECAMLDRVINVRCTIPRLGDGAWSLISHVKVKYLLNAKY